MPYGIPDDLWRRMSPEDQNEVINETLGRGTVPDLGGFAPAIPPPEPLPTPRQPSATKPPDVTWAYVRSLNSFPGNHPFFEADRAAGIGGYMLEAHDLYLIPGAQACRDAGFHVGVWSDPHGQVPETYAAELIAAAHSVNADAIAPDPESTGKGYAGSAGWDWNARAAAAIRIFDPTIAVIVTPTPDQDDFNYAAWTQNGALVWVQLYGEKLTDLYNADEVINRVKANGVPASLIGALIPAGSIALYVPELQRLGVTNWAIYTIDDVNEADRQFPFGAGANEPPSSGDLQDILGGDYVPPDDPTDVDYLAQFLDEGQGEPPDDFEGPDFQDTDVLLDVDGTSVEPDTDPEETATVFALRRKILTPWCQGLHGTLGLPEFLAYDFCAHFGTMVYAPVDAHVYKFSGHDPRTGWHDHPGEAFGWSMYFRADGYGRTEFYVTHLGIRLVPNGANIKAGQLIGVVGDMPPERSDHIHVGVHGGTISAEDLPYFAWFKAGKATGAFPGTTPAGAPSKAPDTEDIGAEYKRIASFVNSGAEKRRTDLLTLRREIAKRVS